MEHPAELIELILKKYSPSISREYLQFEVAQMAPLVRADLVTVGYMNPGRWRHIADTYSEIGMLPENFALGDFLYEANPETDLSRVYAYLALAVLGIGLASGGGGLHHAGRPSGAGEPGGTGPAQQRAGHAQPYSQTDQPGPAFV